MSDRFRSQKEKFMIKQSRASAIGRASCPSVSYMVVRFVPEMSENLDFLFV